MTDDTKPSSLADFFEIVSHERVYDGFVKLDEYNVRQRRFDGALTPILSRTVVIPHAAVGVLCFDPKRDVVVLVQQARLAAGIAGFETLQTEIVAGIMDTDEPPDAVARREVHEETGLHVVGDLVPIVHMLTTPGHSTEHVHLYCARVDAADIAGFYGVAEEHEDISVLALPFAEFSARVRAGQITNAYSIIAAYWLILNRAQLQTDWGIRDE